MSADLTDNDIANRETIAKLLGFAGRCRAAMRDAIDLLRPEDPARRRLERAMEEKAP